MSGAIDRRAGEIIASTAPKTERDDEERPERARLDLAVDDEGDRAGDPTEQEQCGDPPAVESVGDPAADEEQQDRRDELGETDPADVEFVARDVEGLLEQHRDEEVQADRGERRRQQVPPHGRVPQDVPSAGHGGTLPTRPDPAPRSPARHASFATRNRRPGRRFVVTNVVVECQASVDSASVSASASESVRARARVRRIRRSGSGSGRGPRRRRRSLSIRVVGGDLVGDGEREHGDHDQHHQPAEAVDGVTEGSADHECGRPDVERAPVDERSPPRRLEVLQHRGQRRRCRATSQTMPRRGRRR